MVFDAIILVAIIFCWSWIWLINFRIHQILEKVDTLHTEVNETPYKIIKNLWLNKVTIAARGVFGKVKVLMWSDREFQDYFIIYIKEDGETKFRLYLSTDEVFDKEIGGIGLLIETVANERMIPQSEFENPIYIQFRGVLEKSVGYNLLIKIRKAYYAEKGRDIPMPGDSIEIAKRFITAYNVKNN